MNGKFAPIVVGLALAVASMFMTPFAMAQGGETPEDRAAGFEAATGSSTENVSGLGMMAGAYGLVWTFTMLYLVRLGRIEAGIARDVERLERVLAPE